MRAAQLQSRPREAGLRPDPVRIEEYSPVEALTGHSSTRIPR